MPGRKHDTRLVIYKGQGRQPWRWRLIAANGRNIANGGEGYSRHGNALRAAEKMMALIREGGEVVVILDGKPKKARR